MPDIDVLKDLDAAAAQIAALDMVITTSNTAAHLAGALGVPTQCLLPKTLGMGRRWYWFTHQAECPWYPRVQRHVQSEENVWAGPIAAAALAAAAAAAAKGGAGETAGLSSQSGERLCRRGLLRWPTMSSLSPICNRRTTCRLLHELGAGEEPPARLPRCARETRCGPADRARPGRVQQRARHDPYGYGPRGRGDRRYAVALERLPQSGEIHNNMGTALRAAGRAEDAQREYETALGLLPGRASIKFNLAGIRNERGDVDAALSIYNDVLATEPAHADAHTNKGLALLRAGRLAEGWREFVWRFKQANANVRPEHFPSPVWAGQPLDGQECARLDRAGDRRRDHGRELPARGDRQARKVTILVPRAWPRCSNDRSHLRL